MAADGSPDNPIPAVRVEPVAEAVPVAAAAPVVVAEAAPAVVDVVPAALVVEPVAAIAPEARLELVGEKPSLLETTGKKPEPAKPDGEIKPDVAAKPDADKVAEKKPDVAVDPAKPAEKPAEKPAADKPTTEVAAAAIPEPLPAIDYKYTLPASLKMDEALRGEAHAAFDAFRANPAEGAQALIDLHARTMQAFADNLTAETVRNQHKAFNATRDGWNTEIMADPELGGSGYKTTSQAVARMRDLLVSSAAPGTPEYQQHLKEAEDFYRITGAGDHPVLWRILHNAARFFDEPGLPPQNIKPAPGNGKAPGARRDRMYDHPSSSKASP